MKKITLLFILLFTLVSTSCAPVEATPAVVVTPFRKNTPTPVTFASEDQSAILFQEVDLGNDMARYVLPADGLSMDLSSDWIVLDLTDDNIQEKIEAIVGKNNTLINLLTKRPLESEGERGMRLFAIHDSFQPDIDPMPVAIDIFIQDFPIEIHNEELGVLMADELEKDDELEDIYELSGPVELESVQLGSINAVVLNFTLIIQENAQDEPFTYVTRQYVFLKDGNIVMMSIGMKEVFMDKYMPVAIETAETLQLRP